MAADNVADALVYSVQNWLRQPARCSRHLRSFNLKYAICSCGHRTETRYRIASKICWEVGCIVQSTCNQLTHSTRLASMSWAKRSGWGRIGAIVSFCIQTVDVRIFKSLPASTYVVHGLGSFKLIITNDIQYIKFLFVFQFLFFSLHFLWFFEHDPTGSFDFIIFPSRWFCAWCTWAFISSMLIHVDELTALVLLLNILFSAHLAGVYIGICGALRARFLSSCSYQVTSWASSTWCLRWLLSIFCSPFFFFALSVLHSLLPFPFRRHVGNSVWGWCKGGIVKICWLLER